MISGFIRIDLVSSVMMSKSFNRDDKKAQIGFHWDSLHLGIGLGPDGSKRAIYGSKPPSPWMAIPTPRPSRRTG